MKKIVCITGLCGSGKSTVSDFFVSKGYQYIRFGQIVMDEMKKRKLPLNEKNEQSLREEFREKHGMSAMAILNLSKFDSALKKGNVIADGLYSFEEYRVMKDHFGEACIVVAVYAPPKVRYDRVSKRVMSKSDTNLRDRPFTKADAQLRDNNELVKLNKGGTIAMADYTIQNTRDLQFLLNQLEETYDEISKN